MNLYPGGPIEVGVSRAPAPAAPEPATAPRLDPSAITVTKIEPGSMVTLANGATISAPPLPRLDAAFFADKERVLAMVAHWSRDELYTLGKVLMGEGDHRIEGELLDVLRDWCQDSTHPVTHVEFVTDLNYPEQVYWSDRTVYVHIKERDKPVRVDFRYFEDESEQAAWDKRFRGLLTNYARAVPPSQGDHLVVDLTTGEFERSGKWSLT
ncbi:hypothetical protein ACWDZ4_20170 [Streptomyces sp. NPDC003016]